METEAASLELLDKCATAETVMTVIRETEKTQINMQFKSQVGNVKLKY